MVHGEARHSSKALYSRKAWHHIEHGTAEEHDTGSTAEHETVEYDTRYNRAWDSSKRMAQAAEQGTAAERGTAEHHAVQQDILQESMVQKDKLQQGKGQQGLAP